MRQVEGLLPGAYHYLPMTHQLELLSPMEDRVALADLMDLSLCGQRWAAKATWCSTGALSPTAASGGMAFMPTG